MSRLYDRIMREGFSVPPPLSDDALLFRTPSIRPENRDWVRRHIALVDRTALDAIGGATVVAIDNVADYYFRHPTKTGPTDWDYTDLPNIAPPFPVAFMEFRLRPTQFPGMVRRLPAGALEGAQSGALFVACAAGPMERPPAVLERAHSLNPGAAWLVLAVLFGGYRDRVRVLAHAVYGVATDGRVGLSGTRAGALAYYHHDGGDEPGAPDHLETVRMLAQLQLFPCLLAHCFLHCQNVALRDVAPPPKLARAYRKRHRLPPADPGPVTYKVLDIEPVRTVLRREGQVERVGLKQALHLVRGHFAHYTEDAPAFGKLTGTFWRPLHARGSAAAGRIDKDYRVRRP